MPQRLIAAKGERRVASNGHAENGEQQQSPPGLAATPSADWKGILVVEKT
jgi:hypothetical protein